MFFKLLNNYRCETCLFSYFCYFYRKIYKKHGYYNLFQFYHYYARMHVFYNNFLLKDSTFLGITRVPGYTLYDNGYYPLAVQSETKGHSITGEIYEIGNYIWETIYDMERYAGYKSEKYNELVFFVYKDWLKAVTKNIHIGDTWPLKK